ncbi:unnamed protein product [Phytophthora fragariaefolia]|uniref:Unnamed protein product n=1 Tax=Phytophthora fragariaefolia TaxID=1490495 RepID=A0A9W6TLZ4_9STRA|nr:unnamed protein product [Phytophthora fragariaefolia]
MEARKSTEEHGECRRLVVIELAVLHSDEVSVRNQTSHSASRSIQLPVAVNHRRAVLVLQVATGELGVKAEFLLYMELNSTFQYPEPFAGLSSNYIDNTSMWHDGDCRLPHFMEYNCIAGYGEVNIPFPLSVKLPVIGNKTHEINILSSGDRSRYSLFSGCVATACKVLVWTLGITDIDPDFVNITIVSTASGEILVTVHVAKVSDYMGLDIGVQCANRSWGLSVVSPAAHETVWAGAPIATPWMRQHYPAIPASTDTGGQYVKTRGNYVTAARLYGVTRPPEMVECVSCNGNDGGSLCGDISLGSGCIIVFMQYLVSLVFA